ncbi:metadherin a [Dunckerocampus dactyliophorus]|uniref:metadherin a n=1 Tax=Dunckerocampus dactyliophorus TaxID=161453 RepID=UPI0024051667|nr:metadherin a [Dunckerocampus dactyliophorus]XP_054620642.1 metadherin a [Dunckerocampus dactyliophorus]
MAGDWRGFALLDEAELLSGRLKDLLSSGQAYVRSQFGLDLGMKPELYPTWLMLTTAAVGVLLLLAVSWAAVCGGLMAGRRRRGCPVPRVGSEHPAKTLLTTKPAKPEEVKKRNQKKVREKKTQQPNGQPASVLQEEVKVLSKSPPPQTKTRKAPEVQAPPVLVKKAKKKAKTSVKVVHSVSTHDGKEPDDGAWETKVSNREKRQQRRKDKGPEALGGPQGADGARSHAEASLKVKKNRAESQRSRSSAKVDSSRAAALSTQGEVSSINGGGWNNFSMKIPAQVASMEANKWAPHYQTQPEAQAWTQESQAAWSGIDGQMKSDLSPVSFSMLRLNAADPLSKSMEMQWTSHADADDEWGGINGVAPVDPTSDWNAPVEHWGNYEEPPAGLKLVQLKEQPVPNKVSEDDKDCEDPAGGAAKSKKKRKKKKKTEDEATSEARVVNAVLKPQELPTAASKKPNPSASSPAQKPPEHVVEAAKPSHKKKVRRDA